MDESIVYKYLIKEYKSASSRTRSVFIIVNIVTLIFLVGYFNNRLSWLRHLAPISISEQKMNVEETPEVSRPDEYLEFVNPGSSNEKEIDIRKRLFEETLKGDYLFINIPFIGSKVFVDDLPLLGGIGLVIIMIWFHYVIRREEGIAKKIKMDLDKKKLSNETKSFLFHGTVLNEIFYSVDNIDFHTKEEEKSFENGFLKRVRQVMLFAPVIVLGIIIVHDSIETFVLPNIINEGVEITLFRYLKSTGQYWQVFEIFLRLFFSVSLVSISLSRAWGIDKINDNLVSHLNLITEMYWEAHPELLV